MNEQLLLRMARLAATKTGWTMASTVVRNRSLIKKHLRHVSPQRMGRFANQVQLAWQCTADWHRRRYRQIPWRTVSMLAAALAYFVLPFDVVPDWIPGAGFLDDAALFGFVLRAAESDLRRYCTWRGLDPADYFG
jgi:uncharacterized membrane protein YkvA (DUF1232 family)